MRNSEFFRLVFSLEHVHLSVVKVKICNLAEEDQCSTVRVQNEPINLHFVLVFASNHSWSRLLRLSTSHVVSELILNYVLVWKEEGADIIYVYPQVFIRNYIYVL